MLLVQVWLLFPNKQQKHTKYKDICFSINTTVVSKKHFQPASCKMFLALLQTMWTEYTTLNKGGGRKMKMPSAMKCYVREQAFDVTNMDDFYMYITTDTGRCSDSIVIGLDSRLKGHHQSLDWHNCVATPTYNYSCGSVNGYL